jgi:hypothetical protein
MSTPIVNQFTQYQQTEQDPAKLPPAPLPQQFGYDPAKQAGSPATNEETNVPEAQ